jgi:hypothetical protein
MHEIELRFRLQSDLKGVNEGYFASRREIGWMEDDKVSAQGFFN